MLFIVFDERHDMDIVLSTEDPDVVVHPDAASVHVQNRWIGGKKEYVHYSGASDDTTEPSGVRGTGRHGALSNSVGMIKVRVRT